ncbi:MAG: AAA family ATPase [Calditrichota bacterium]
MDSLALCLLKVGRFTAGSPAAHPDGSHNPLRNDASDKNLMEDQTVNNRQSAGRSGTRLMTQITDRLRGVVGRFSTAEPTEHKPRRSRKGIKEPSVNKSAVNTVENMALSKLKPTGMKLQKARPAQIRHLEAEIQGLKQTLRDVMASVQQNQTHYLPEVFRQVEQRLRNNDIHEALTKAIIDAVYSQTQPSESQDRRLLEKRLALLVLQLIRQAPAIESVKVPGYKVALLGPTGVGKTTTVAKIAANLKLNHGRKVALITSDTFRIAAIEQLQTFANIAGIPLSVVYSPTEMQQEIERYRNYDFILIDTVGRSQKNQRQLSELKEFLDAADPHERHLVLSLTNGKRTLFDVATRFSDLNPNRFIFTKLDESTTPGVMLNLLYKFQLPVSYLTTGQTVPTDLRPARLKEMAKLILYGNSGV